MKTLLEIINTDNEQNILNQIHIPMNTQLTAASPLHDKIEDDILEMSLNETEAQEYRDLVWKLINESRFTFISACSAAMNQIILNSVKN